MGSISILLGRSRWRRRAVLPAEAFSGIDGWGQPTFLFIAPSAAKRRAVERDFVAYRPTDVPCFAPSVRVLDEFLADIWVRHGDGRAPLTRRAACAIAAKLLRNGAEQWPSLHGLGAPQHVASELVRLAEARALAGKPELPDVPHRHELASALKALETALDGLAYHIFRPSLWGAMHELLAHPSPALMGQLRQFRTIILDDLIQPAPLERSVLIALSRAFAAAGGHVVLALETGRDLGGAEAGLFFEYDDVHRAAYALRPFQATRSLRRTLFDELIATGEAAVGIALRTGLKPLDPGVVHDDPEPPDLSDHLYGPRPLPVRTTEQARTLLRDTVQIRRYADTDAERRAIARQIKARLLGGAAPSDCLVAIPNLAGQAASIRAIFADFGVPIRLERRASLDRQPLAILAASIGGLALNGWPVSESLDLLDSQLVHGAADRRVWCANLRDWCAAAGITAGLPSSWGPALADWFSRSPRLTPPDSDVLDTVLQDLDQRLAPLDALGSPQTPSAWRDALCGHLERLGLPENAHGDALDAWSALVEALDQLVLDLEVEGAEALPPEQLYRELTELIARTSLRPQPRSGGRVEVVDTASLLGLTPRFLWVMGLTRGGFPGTDPASFLVPAAYLRRLEVPRKGDWGRYLLSSLLRNALDDTHVELLSLSWPQLEAGKPTAPSPLLQDLLHLPTLVPTAAGSTALFGDVIDVDATIDSVPASTTDALRRAASSPAWLTLVPPDARPIMLEQDRVWQARTGPEPTVYEGMLGAAISPIPTAMGVTRLESYLQCPARFWYAEILGLQEVETATEEVAANRRGTVLHAILEAFLTPRLGQRLPDDPVALGRELHQVALTHLDQLRSEGGFSPALLDSLQEDWLAGLVDGAPRGVLAQWLRLELEQAPVRTATAVELDRSLSVGPLRLRARLDRVDRTARGQLVIDYKSGAAPETKMVNQGLALQPVVYAAMLAQNDPRPVASTYLTLRSPTEVKATGWVGEPQVFEDLGLGKRGTNPQSADDRNRTLHHAAEGGRRMHSGVFHTTLASQTAVGCAYCAFARICRVNPERNRKMSLTNADLQRPLEPEDAP